MVIPNGQLDARNSEKFQIVAVRNKKSLPTVAGRGGFPCRRLRTNQGRMSHLF